MNAFINGFNHFSSEKTTENGALAYSSTGNALVDMFGTIGSMRSRSDEDIINKFEKAYAEAPLYAVRTVFYARDIRGGLGERRIFRVLLKHIATKYPGIVEINLPLIAEYGRWDDYYTLVGTPLESLMWEFLYNQLCQDAINMNSGKPISLLSKWLKSASASSKESKELAFKTMQAFQLTPKMYRLVLSSLRKYLKVTEGLMSRRAWNEIDYSKVPSLAMHKYKKAFYKNDEERFNEFKSRLLNAETPVKINASTLYPYNIVEKILYSRPDRNEKEIMSAQWKALPNYVEGENNIMIMADVSGSMYGRPMATSIGLAIYFAERNRGVFGGKFITFTDKPHFISINPKGDIFENIGIASRDVGYSTNLEKAFQLILDTAIKTNCPQEDLPTTLVVISDNEIDKYQTYSASELNFVETMRKRFERSGYKLPKLVMWNVDARQDTFHAPSHDGDVQFVSGQSPSVFKGIVKNSGLNAVEMIIETLSEERYSMIKI